MVDKKFIEQALKAHNEYRARHKVAALKHNKDVSVIAQRWADHLASTGSFQHSSDRKFKGDSMGENIAMKWTSGGDDFTGQQVTNQWYSEVTKYNYSANSGSNAGHFTQVVWKDSREFGIGRAQGRDGKWIVVGNYVPAGNFMGKYTANVFPPKDGKTSLIGEGAAAPKADLGYNRPSSSSSSSSSSSDGSRGRGGYTPSHGGNVGSESHTAGGGRSVSRQVRTVTEGSGPNKVTKTIVTETVIGPDGQKTVTTKETVNAGDGGAALGNDFDSRFKSMGFGDRFGNSGSSAPMAAVASADVKPQKMKDFVEDVVKQHNKYRRNHGRVGDLRHNKALSSLAQSWADRLAQSSVLSHSNARYKGQEVGENVASKWSSGGADYTGDATVDQWYSEVSKFDFRDGDFRQGTGHFTQVVWRDSKEIGVGKALSSDGSRVVVVCNYFPAGNVMGRFRDNVFPEK